MNDKILELLYRSFDDELSPEERKQLDEALQNSQGLRAEKAKISNMRATITNSAEKSFGSNFADGVMSRVHAQKQFPEYTIDDFLDSLLWSFKRIGLVASFTLLLLLANNIFKGGDISIDSILAMPQITMEETWELTDLTEGEFK